MLALTSALHASGSGKTTPGGQSAGASAWAGSGGPGQGYVITMIAGIHPSRWYARKVDRPAMRMPGLDRGGVACMLPSAPETRSPIPP